MWATFSSQSVGALSAVTLALSLAGNTARVFTTLVFAKGDRALLGLFGLGFALNAARAVQFAMYA